MSLLWQPYSFFKIIGSDSAKFTLNNSFYNLFQRQKKIWNLLTSTIARRVCPSMFLSWSILCVTCLQNKTWDWIIISIQPTCRFACWLAVLLKHHLLHFLRVPSRCWILYHNFCMQIDYFPLWKIGVPYLQALCNVHCERLGFWIQIFFYLIISLIDLEFTSQEFCCKIW